MIKFVSKVPLVEILPYIIDSGQRALICLLNE